MLVANDTWFAPSDVTVGPDGAVYVADWYDKRTAHPDPDADWDRSNGRIYKIEWKAGKSRPALDLTRLSSMELVKLLAQANDWYVRRARRILADRRDPVDHSGDGVGLGRGAPGEGGREGRRGRRVV